jgi:cyclase
VERTARDVFVPITVGGGIRSLDDIRAALRSGAEKVAINTWALLHPEFVREAADAFGSSTIVVSIEAKRRGAAWEAYSDSGRERSGRDAVAWAQEAVRLGAGELLVTSIDRDGTRSGYDVELMAAIAPVVSVPVIACGGAGSAEHVAAAVQQGKADAVAIGALLHYGGSTIAELKHGLNERGVKCRKAA